jgi:hypothetical protein
MKTLNIKDAVEYVVASMGRGVHILSARPRSDEGFEYIAIEGKTAGGVPFLWEIWEEKDELGHAFLYGEW